jgi:predicted nucleic acid-binding protein
MPRVPTIYLETTMFNFPFVDDAPEYREDTLKLFEAIESGKFKPFTSDYVIQELNNTPAEEQRERMKALVPAYGVTVIPISAEIRRLANIYIAEGVIPKRFVTDALHLATTTVAGLEYIVSLNLRHIVKNKTIVQTKVINVREGYKQVLIHTPKEVLNYAEDA